MRIVVLLALVGSSFGLLSAPSAPAGRQKVDITVAVNDGIGKNQPPDSLFKTGGTMDGALVDQQIFRKLSDM